MGRCPFLLLNVPMFTQRSSDPPFASSLWMLFCSLSMASLKSSALTHRPTWTSIGSVEPGRRWVKTHGENPGEPPNTWRIFIVRADCFGANRAVTSNDGCGDQKPDDWTAVQTSQRSLWSFQRTNYVFAGSYGPFEFKFGVYDHSCEVFSKNWLDLQRSCIIGV